MTEDSDEGNKEDPLSQDRYVYARDNPMRYVDVNGHETHAWEFPNLYVFGNLIFERLGGGEYLLLNFGGGDSSTSTSTILLKVTSTGWTLTTTTTTTTITGSAGTITTTTVITTHTATAASIGYGISNAPLLNDFVEIGWGSLQVLAGVTDIAGGVWLISMSPFDFGVSLPLGTGAMGTGVYEIIQGLINVFGGAYGIGQAEGP